MYHIIIIITLHKPVITISISLTFGISNYQFYRYDTCIPRQDNGGRLGLYTVDDIKSRRSPIESSIFS